MKCIFSKTDSVDRTRLAGSDKEKNCWDGNVIGWKALCQVRVPSYPECLLSYAPDPFRATSARTKKSELVLDDLIGQHEDWAAVLAHVNVVMMEGC